jgi:hypothetical protein
VTQLVVVAIDQVHSRAAVIVTAPLPPLAVNDVGVLLAVTSHFASRVGPVTDVSVLLHAANPDASASESANAGTAR